jgi:CheY-like chemotaxis protein
LIDPPADGPDEFELLVRDGLQHLFDPAYLQTHTLAAYTGAASSDRIARGRLVRQALLDAIQALHPGSSVTATSHGWRAYRLLELRYVEAREVADVAAELALSKRQYHREHGRALKAVASLLAERWRRPAPPEGPSLDTRPGGTADLARMEARRLVDGDHASAVDVGEVLRGVRELVGPLCTASNAALRLELPVQPVAALGGRVALRQALLSLVAPPIKASPGGEIVTTVRRRGSEVEVEIAMPRLDDPDVLRQALRECEPFVEALDARLSSDPTVQRSGPTVTLHLRAADRPLLLVVDNSPDFVRLVERYLAGYDWGVLGASDVDEAYALARQRRPWAILLDAVMPGRDGWDLLLDLKRDRTTREIPVVLCSVLDEPGLALSLGAADYLHKPVDQSQLVATLARLR